MEQETVINHGLDEIKSELFKNSYKRECRKIALQSAERVNPSEYNYNQNGGGQRSKPNMVQILADADKIYEWLTKDL